MTHSNKNRRKEGENKEERERQSKTGNEKEIYHGHRRYKDRQWIDQETM